mmetsp:Transcript_52869/g.123717  ORF Transcript_52869/g.123717 Transcript_52869/m.123717 type:complete len:508 (-) Transcript_52869:37-1560(-)
MGAHCCAAPSKPIIIGLGSTVTLALVHHDLCSPDTVAIQLMLYVKGLHYRAVRCSSPSCAPAWLKVVSPSGLCPTLALLPQAALQSEYDLSDIIAIPQLCRDASQPPSLLAIAQYLDILCAEPPRLVLSSHPIFQEIDNFLKEVERSIMEICLNPSLGRQKEMRNLAVAAMTRLDVFLSASGNKTLLGTEACTYLDCILLSCLHWYSILIHFRSWTPETKPGSVSEEDPPTIAQSTLPVLAAYRQLRLKELQHILPAQDALLAFAESQVIQPTPLSAWWLQHQSLRWWMREIASLLIRFYTFAEDQILADNVVTLWSWCATFIKEHVAVEDEVIYKALEQHTPGCTNAYAAELELHMPLLLQSVDAVKALAANKSRQAADVRKAKKRIETLCKAFEFLFNEKETHLLPVLESLDMQQHYALFQKCLCTGQVLRQELFPFVLHGLSLSEQELYWRNILDHGQLPGDEIKNIHACMRMEFDKCILSEYKVRRLEDRVPELARLREQMSN